jgi:hypothetical protein
VSDENKRAVTGLVRKLAGLPRDKVEEVLAELDPAFTREVLAALTGGMRTEDRAKILRVARRLEEEFRPDNDIELYAFVVEECGIGVPRTGVCEGHCAPFDFMADVYFERGDSDKLAIGNRGSGKTQIMGALHAVCARTKKKYTSCTVGAVEAQALRAYGFFRELIAKERWAKLVKGRVTMAKTEFEHGGVVEIVTGTITGVNSPHPVLAHFDEVELLRPGVYEEALNMAQSKNGYQAMNVLTSSWKKPKGFVSSLVDDVRKAEIDGARPPYQVYRWCVWETTVRCEHDCDACPFADVVRGEWEDGTKRTFESACKKGSPKEGVGKLKFTDGFVTIDDALGRFRKLPRRVWEAQQESKRPTLEGLIYDVFDPDLHVVERWHPDPANGVIDCGLDFGGTVPHAACLWQHLDVEVEHRGRRIPVGAHVCFDEVYVTGGNVQFAQAILARLDFWRSEYPGFEMSYYGDPAARAAREDFAALPSLGLGEAIRVKFSGGNDTVDPGIAMIRDLMERDMVYVDEVRCSNWMDEVGGYERSETTGKPVKDADHLMDATRYRFWTRHAMTRRRNMGGGSGLVGSGRPRAVVVKDGERGWDPSALGQVPAYGREAEEPMTPLVGSIPRGWRDM